ncbi:hypothetical protein TNCV_2882621 [Trichonephila clavipes]|nr:hypothetical protein TNCV_2882621 [Trichonephila clavipes]
MVVNSHLSIHNRFYGFTSCSGQVRHPSIVPEFLRSISCGMTSERGHGAIVYCLNSGSEDRRVAIMVKRGGGKKKREGQEKVGRERTGKEKRREEKTGETEKEKGRVRDWSEKTMNAGGVENGI